VRISGKNFETVYAMKEVKVAKKADGLTSLTRNGDGIATNPAVDPGVAPAAAMEAGQGIRVGMVLAEVTAQVSLWIVMTGRKEQVQVSVSAEV
jgi:hypothetical protein